MDNVRNSFPLLKIPIDKNPLIYFDNAATTQKPDLVIDSIVDYYQQYNSNIHRGAHHLANVATDAYEEVREKVARFIGATSSKEIIFTSGTTASINLLMQSWGRINLTQKDRVVLSEMEHHANIVPWLFLQKDIGFEIAYIPMGRDCQLDISELETTITDNTKLVSIAHISNAIGTIHPIERIGKLAKQKGAKIHIDMAQSIHHLPTNVSKMDIDFASFSSHKMYGPMGVGVFWGKAEHLDKMQPFMFGGEMIQEVYLDKVTYNQLPYKFQAGTPNVADVIGLGRAVDFIETLKFSTINKHEKALHSYMMDKISKIPKVKLYTPRVNSSSVVSFTVQGIHSYDIGQLLDAKGIAIRTGHHCCQPLMRKLNIEGTCRASLAIYNTQNEIDTFIDVLKKSIAILERQ